MATKTSPSSRDFQRISEQYIDDVLTGLVIACKWVKLACQRQRDDLARQGKSDFPYTYDATVGTKVCKFIEICPHVEGRKFAGRRIKLEPWQVFFFMTFCSWVDAEGGVRFRRGYLTVGKGNGKSTMSGPLGIYRAFADKEPGSQVYSAAVSKDQAKIVWGAARQMLLNMEDFVARAGIEIEKHSLHQAKSNSLFRPLAADDRTSEGKNPYLVIIDELHAHPDRNFYDSLDTATGKRQGAQLLIITTRGSDLSSVCYEVDVEVQKVLAGLLKNDTLFGVIYCPDEKEDPMTPTAWLKANPNWGVSVDPKTIQEKAASALQIPSQRPSFMTKHCNIWVKSDSSWMDMMRFMSCADDTLKIEDFVHDESVLGLDLASKLDILAGMQVFWRNIPDAKGVMKRHYYAFGDYWMPEAQVNKKENAHYKGWVEGGILHQCAGENNDYDEVEDWIRARCKRFKVQRAAHDQYQAVELVNHLLGEGVPMAEFNQKAVWFTPPMDELEAAVLDGRFHYNGDPILAWGVSNVVCHRDRNNMLFPTRDGLANKIDPAVALLMAIASVTHVAGAPRTGGGGLTVVGNCCKCTALCIGEMKDGQMNFLCDKCREKAKVA